MPLKPSKEKLTGKFNFSYTAKNQKDKIVKGEISAENITLGRSQLRKQGFKEIRLQRVRAPSALTKFLAKKKIKSIDITVFTRQMATMQTAGLPLVQGLKVVIDSTASQPVAKLISKIKDEVESGGSFSECLRYHPEEFDELYCNLVEAGESSGSLEAMLSRIATYREKTETLKRKLKKAMFYPVAVMGVALIVTAILLIKVVPTFRDMFEGFGAELPAFTRFVLTISDGVQHNAFKVFSVMAATVWFTRKMYITNEKFRNFLQALILKAPVFGAIMKKAAVARFARTLSTTFSAGVPLPEALLLVAKASGNIVYYRAIMKMRDGVSIGQRINISMLESKIFPSMVVQMIAIGEETGALDAMLLKIANIYEEEVDLAVDSLSSLLEPLIMLFLGVVVGGLVIAMYLPIFKMGSVI